jgi:hypothetical protein
MSQQYMYGGRPLDMRPNDRWHTFTPTAAKGAQAIPIQADGNRDVKYLIVFIFLSLLFLKNCALPP